MMILGWGPPLARMALQTSKPVIPPGIITSSKMMSGFFCSQSTIACGPSQASCTSAAMPSVAMRKSWRMSSWSSTISSLIIVRLAVCVMASGHRPTHCRCRRPEGGGRREAPYSTPGQAPSWLAPHLRSERLPILITAGGRFGRTGQRRAGGLGQAGLLGGCSLGQRRNGRCLAELARRQGCRAGMPDPAGLAVDLEHRHQFSQALRLVLQAVCGSGAFFHQCRVLLCDLIELVHRIADLADAAALLHRGAGDLVDQRAHALDLVHDAFHALAGLVHQNSAVLHLLDTGADQALDFLGGFSRTPGQAAHL